MKSLSLGNLVRADEVESALPRFIGIAGWKTWNRRRDQIADAIRRNPLADSWLNETFSLELQILAHKKHVSVRGRMPSNLRPWYRPCHFIAALNRIYFQLYKQAQTRIAGVMRHYLTEGTYGLAPLEAELLMAVHLSTRGFEVTFSDLERGGFDLLAKSGSLAVEVDVKWMSADVGRKIHRRKLYDLSGYIYPMLINGNTTGGHLVQIKIPNRLHGDTS